MVSDIEGLGSETAVAMVFVQSVDNPPVLDLNGPSQPGRNHSTSYTEGSSPILVSAAPHSVNRAITMHGSKLYVVFCDAGVFQ